jgi:twitching motility protein PilJ
LSCLCWQPGLALLAKIYLDDTQRRAEAVEKERQASEALNRENQDAILRLMNELGDLADGDLTVTATVSESVTGAIADSINYTIEELRVLVGRINDAANRVTLATEIARQTSPTCWVQRSVSQAKFRKQASRR